MEEVFFEEDHDLFHLFEVAESAQVFDRSITSGWKWFAANRKRFHLSNSRAAVFRFSYNLSLSPLTMTAGRRSSLLVMLATATLRSTYT